MYKPGQRPADLVKTQTSEVETGSTEVVTATQTDATMEAQLQKL
jgi:hypothetical protein